MGIFDGLFGDDRKANQANAQAQINGYNQAQDYMNPYYQGGLNAYNNLTNYTNGMNQTLGQHTDPLSMGYMRNYANSTPQEIYQNMMKGYSTSPQATNQMNEMMRAANSYGAASGMQGSGAEFKRLQENANDITARDQDRYYQNMMSSLGQQQNYLNNYTQDYRHLQDQYLQQMMGMSQLGQQSAYMQGQNAIGRGNAQGAYDQARYSQPNYFNDIAKGIGAGIGAFANPYGTAANAATSQIK